MNRFAWGGALLLIISCVFSSCSFHRLVTRKKAKSYDSSAAQPVAADTGRIGAGHAVLPAPDTVALVQEDTSAAEKRLAEQLTPIWKKRLDYQTFKAKAKVHFESPDDKQEFTANIRVRKDSVIWINASAFGITAARILITPDSIFMIMELKKEYKKLALKDAAKILPTKVDFATLQHLLLGEPLRDGNIEDATSFGGSWSLGVEDSSYIQRITYNKEDSTIRTSQLRTRKANGPQTMSEYGSYEMINNRKVSTQRVINIRNGEDVYMLDMNFQKIDFDEPLEYPFSIPKSYSEQK
jgi:hypothetical protein